MERWGNRRSSIWLYCGTIIHWLHYDQYWWLNWRIKVIFEMMSINSRVDYDGLLKFNYFGRFWSHFRGNFTGDNSGLCTAIRVLNWGKLIFSSCFYGELLKVVMFEHTKSNNKTVLIKFTCRFATIPNIASSLFSETRTDNGDHFGPEYWAYKVNPKRR